MENLKYSLLKFNIRSIKTFKLKNKDLSKIYLIKNIVKCHL